MYFQGVTDILASLNTYTAFDREAVTTVSLVYLTPPPLYRVNPRS